MRQCESWSSKTGVYFQSTKGAVYLPDLTPTGWCQLYGDTKITEDRIAQFPNAKLGAEIQGSPLYKALE